MGDAQELSLIQARRVAQYFVHFYLHFDRYIYTMFFLNIFLMHIFISFTYFLIQGGILEVRLCMIHLVQ